MQVKFNDSDIVYEINAYQISGNTVTIKGENIPTDNASGFVLLDGKVKIDCSGYVTKYNVLTELENGAMYSNDGSVETEEKRVIVFSKEHAVTILEQMKQDKIIQSKTLLGQFLAENPLLSTCHGGEYGTYSVTEEKQSLMMSQYMTYQIEKALNPDAKLTWNESGEACEVWTEEEFLQLVLETKQYVYPLVSHQQTLEKKIAACTTVDELDAITINYAEG